MFDYDRGGVKAILEDFGFKVLLWDFPVGNLGGYEGRTIPRRVFELVSLEHELSWLHENDIRTIALYTVTPLGEYLCPEENRKKPVPGKLIRWAYQVGV